MKRHEAMAFRVRLAFVKARLRRLGSVRPGALEKTLVSEAMDRKVGAWVSVVAFVALPAVLCRRNTGSSGDSKGRRSGGHQTALLPIHDSDLGCTSDR